MSALSPELIKQHAQCFTAQKKWYRALSQRAAVAIIVEDHPQLGLAFLMIQRAEREGDPWSGQMAFPGGKHDTDDQHITHTALREIEEELGVPGKSLHRFGRLSDILARPYRIQQKPMVVSPLLFEPLKTMHFCPNEEVADVLWVPVSYFTDPSHRQVISWNRYGKQVDLPCYYYQDKKIWGMSLLMIDEFMQDLLLLQ
jgi:8-oxo-dGTP pyrophosphatase MutT (NUDIX family)